MTRAKPADHENPSRQRTVLLAADLKNSVLAELDAGNPNRIAYSPYGQQSAQRGVMTRLGFNGELCEVKPEWYLLGNGYRAYNPRLMRFHSPDSLSPFGEGGLNAYGYCEGEPVMNSDPTGQSIWVTSRALQLFTGRVTNIVTKVADTTASVTKNAVKSTASLVSSRMTEVSDALGKAKKTLIAITVGSEPFPVRPNLPAKAPVKLGAAHSGTPLRFNRAGQQIKLTTSSGQKQPASGDYHVAAALSGRQSTQLLHKATGAIVADVRTGP
jgi:RHS repeat-associated protein